MSPTHFFFSTMFMLGLLGLTFYRKHLLSVLLCLEGMMLSLFIAFSLWLSKTETIAFSTVPMILITFSACGAGVGLTLLIATIRTHNADHLQSLNILQC